jgi:hypothetical protein
MARSQRIFRYRKPSINQLLGVTQAKRKISRQLGLAALRDPTTPIKNMERRALRKTGYYSEPIKLARALGILKRGGCGSLFLLSFTLLTIQIFHIMNI